MTTATFDRLSKSQLESPLILQDIRSCLKALEFYANRDNWVEPDRMKRHMVRAEADQGYCARRALGLEKPRT